MDNEKTKLRSKIQYLEDKLLLCKGYEYDKMEALQRDLMKLRIRLQKMETRSWR